MQPLAMGQNDRIHARVLMAEQGYVLYDWRTRHRPSGNFIGRASAKYICCFSKLLASWRGAHHSRLIVCGQLFLGVLVCT